MSNESSRSSHKEVQTCPLCRAAIRENTRECWLCGHSLSKDIVNLQPSTPHDPVGFTQSSFALTMALGAILIGAFLWDIGLGIMICIFTVPVFIRTMIVIKKRGEAGLPVGPGKQFVLAAGSFATVLITTIVVYFSALATFCAVCLGTYALTEDEFALVFGGCASAGAAITVLFFAVRFMIKRFKRDITKP